MNEFDLQMYERELMAWQRRLERQPPGPLTSTLHELWDEVHRLRAGCSDERDTCEDVGRRLALLRALYEAYTRPQADSSL